MHRLHGMEMFVEVAKTRNFTRAAEQLGIPKSTLSRQVAELEHAVGLRLLRRTTRKVELTEAGQLYFERCLRIVSDARVAHEELRNLVETPTGLLRVNMPADFGTDFLTDVFVAYSNRYPGINFHLDSASPEHASRVFQSCDVTIAIGQQPDSSHIARLLGNLSASLYASPEYLARHGEPRHPDELAHHECLQFRASNRQAYPWPLRSGDTLVEVAPRSRFSVNSIAMLRSLTQQGAGIGILAASAGGVRADLASGRIQRILPEWKAGPFPVYAITETRLLPIKTRAFIEFLIERLGGGDLVE